MSTAADRSGPKRQLSLIDSTAIVVGMVIGAGIYETAPVIAASVGAPSALVGVWLLGGVLSLIGAACYAELATRFPVEGGDYVFLNEAWGESTGFMFAWTAFWVTQPANTGALAYIFARYADQVLPLGEGPAGIFRYAAGAVLALTAVNVLGVPSGKWTQNLLTGLKVAGLVAVIGAGLLAVGPLPAATAAPAAVSEPSFALAMILVLFTYGGWRVIAYVAAEVERPEVNILRALMLGTAAVTVIYVLITLAFLRVLGMDGMAQSQAVAADTLSALGGECGATAVSVLIAVTCLGTINAMLFTGPRIYYALGRRQSAYRWFGLWHSRLDAPVRALLVQGGLTLAMVVLLAGHPDSFERLVVLSAPVHWFFFMLSGIALFRLRRRGAGAPGAFPVPFYPATPIIFCLTSAFMLYASVTYAWSQRQPEGLWVVAVIVAGLLVHGAGTRARPADAGSP
jgi:amino acid transporter